MKWQNFNFCSGLKPPVYAKALSHTRQFVTPSQKLQDQAVKAIPDNGEESGCPLLECDRRYFLRTARLAWLPLTGVCPALCGSSPAEANGMFQQGIRPVNCSCTWILIIAAKRSSFYLPSQEGWSAFSARVGQRFQCGRKGKIVSCFCCLRARYCFYENRWRSCCLLQAG